MDNTNSTSTTNTNTSSAAPVNYGGTKPASFLDHWRSMPPALKIGASSFFAVLILAILISIIVKGCGH